mmetsp:Transcript_26141/g.57269  ORF Transcript_26141/g.57269 Transcript_26141/m.57269 type:complete len:200 (+) Transcript_26141:1167-1766(+)
MPVALTGTHLPLRRRARDVAAYTRRARLLQAHAGRLLGAEMDLRFLFPSWLVRSRDGRQALQRPTWLGRDDRVLRQSSFDFENSLQDEAKGGATARTQFDGARQPALGARPHSIAAGYPEARIEHRVCRQRQEEPGTDAAQHGHVLRPAPIDRPRAHQRRRQVVVAAQQHGQVALPQPARVGRQGRQLAPVGPRALHSL